MLILTATSLPHQDSSNLAMRLSSLLILEIRSLKMAAAREVEEAVRVMPRKLTLKLMFGGGLDP